MLNCACVLKFTVSFHPLYCVARKKNSSPPSSSETGDRPEIGEYGWYLPADPMLSLLSDDLPVLGANGGSAAEYKSVPVSWESETISGVPGVLLVSLIELIPGLAVPLTMALARANRIASVARRLLAMIRSRILCFSLSSRTLSGVKPLGNGA